MVYKFKAQKVDLASVEIYYKQEGTWLWSGEEIGKLVNVDPNPAENIMK